MIKSWKVKKCDQTIVVSDSSENAQGGAVCKKLKPGESTAPNIATIPSNFSIIDYSAADASDDDKVKNFFIN